MANPKIQLTYLWTDETVMLDDFRWKTSRDMGDWATAFYRKFGLDVDIQPAADVRSGVKSASKFALRKDKGIQPAPSKIGPSVQDLTLLVKLLDKSAAKAKASYEAIVKANASEAALDAHLAADKVLMDTDMTAMSLPQMRAHMVDVRASRAEADRLRAILKTNRQEADRLKAESDQASKAARAQDRKIQNLRTVVRSDVEMRKQLSEKFKKDGIGDGHRLNVVFSKFEHDPTETTARSITYLSMPDPVLDAATRMFLWPYTYVVVDLKAPVSSVAHEIVRAAGHVPPDAQKIFKEMEKRIRGLKQPLGVIGRQPVQSLFDEDAWEYDYIPHYEEIPGGFLDGPKNDIMNAGREDTLPEDIILSDPDKRRLLAAPFVST